MTKTTSTYVAIMAGGVGSRFWPSSRSTHPKQFLDILGVGKSLLQLTFERFLNLCPSEHIFIVTNGIYRDLVKEQLPALTDNQILCEPSRNNTAPCIAYAALKIQGLDPDANMIVAPSDHVILQEGAFLEALREGLAFTAAHDALLTLGIQPSRPDTGYGYIHFERTAAEGRVHAVRQFTEKPPLEQAQAFLASGDYLWNAGIFVWRVHSVMDAFRHHAAAIYDILGKGREVYNTPAEQAFIDTYYPSTPNISVDFAIMEKADNVYTIPSSFGWSDLGTWASLFAESPKDGQGNAALASAHLLDDTTDCLIKARPEKLVVIKGLHDFIVVDEPDALLIYPKNKEQEIKNVTESVKQRFGDRYL